MSRVLSDAARASATLGAAAAFRAIVRDRATGTRRWDRGSAPPSRRQGWCGRRKSRDAEIEPPIGLTTISWTSVTASTMMPKDCAPTRMITASCSDAPAGSAGGARVAAVRRGWRSAAPRRAIAGSSSPARYSILCSPPLSPTASTTECCGRAKRWPLASTISAGRDGQRQRNLQRETRAAGRASRSERTEPPIAWMFSRTTSMPTPRPDTLVTRSAVEKPGAKMKR